LAQVPMRYPPPRVSFHHFRVFCPLFYGWLDSRTGRQSGPMQCCDLLQPNVWNVQIPTPDINAAFML